MSDYTFEYDSTQKTLQIMKVTSNTTLQAPKLYLKPSYDFGTFDTVRSHTPEADYLYLLRSGVLSATLDSRTIQFGFGDGDSYKNGFALKLDSNGLATGLTNNEQVTLNLTLGTIDRAIRIEFEVV
jgi:hypothetical protein